MKVSITNNFNFTWLLASDSCAGEVYLLRVDSISINVLQPEKCRTRDYDYNRSCIQWLHHLGVDFQQILDADRRMVHRFLPAEVPLLLPPTQRLPIFILKYYVIDVR